MSLLHNKIFTTIVIQLNRLIKYNKINKQKIYIKKTINKNVNHTEKKNNKDFHQMINIINNQFLPVSRFFVPNRNQQPFVIVFFEKLTAETYIHSYSLIYQHHVISNLSISIIYAFPKKSQ